MGDPEDSTESGTTNDGEVTERIDDDQLPEDLQPSEDNPLAEPLEPGEEIEGQSPETP